MKKIFTSLLTFAFLAVAGTSWAQTDVTSQYIKNPGFEDCTAITANQTTSSTEDYASSGWTLGGGHVDNSCGAVVSYGSTYTLNDATAPTSDNAGATGNALGISAGWGASVYYTSDEVTLPVGTYALTANVYNANTSSENMTSLLGFGSYTSIKTSFASSKWVKDVVVFTLTEETTGKFQIGGTAQSSTSTTNAKIFIDNLTLVKYESISECYKALGDVTFLIANPTINGSTGWTTSKPNGGNGPLLNSVSFEYWQSSAAKGAFDYYQTIKNLPAGKYTVSAEMYNSTNGESGATFSATSGVYASSGNNEVYKLVDVDGTELIKYTTDEITVTNGELRIGIKSQKTMTARWFVADNFSLTFVEAATADDYYTNIEALVNSAKAISGVMNKTVSETLSAAITAGENAIGTTKETDLSKLDKITSDLESAITAANTSISDYATAKTYLDAAETANLDDAGKANYAADATVSAIQTAYTNGTLEAVTTEQITALDAALITAVKAQTTVGSDMTLAIVNPSFETGNYNGWTTTKSNDTGAKSTSNNTYKMEDAAGNYLFNTWSTGYEISQTITGLQPGKYTVSAVMGTDANQTLVLKMNSTEATAASVDKSTGVTVSGDVLVTDGTLTISAGTSNQYWYKVDNFKLTFVEAIKLDDYYTKIEGLLTSAKAITGDMSETASTVLNEAILAGETATGTTKETNIDKLNSVISDLESSIAAANVSVAEYSRGAAINALITKTSGSIDVTSAVVSDVFEGWSQSGNETFHKNTWSSEGETDGSSMITPFVEDWLSSGKKLADNVLTFNTISGLKAGQYKVSLLTRIVNQASAGDYSGATLNINETAIDLSDGTALSGIHNGVYKTAEAVVTVEDKGSIAINIEIKNVTFNWISFKDLKIVYLNDNVVLDETMDDALAADLTTNYPGATDITINFTRNFTKDLNSTICLPYDVTPDANAGTFYTFAGVTEENGEYVVTMSENTATTLTANTPYLFKPAGGEVTFTGKIAKVADTYTPTDVTEGDWTFAGSYNKVQWNAESAWEDYTAVYCYSMSATETNISDGDFVKVKKPSTGFVSTPFRCMMKYKAAASEGEGAKAREMNTIPSSMKVVLINADGTSTAIDAIDVETEFADGAWYTIDGRKLQGKPAVKGIYINGGQKVLIK